MCSKSYKYDLIVQRQNDLLLLGGLCLQTPHFRPSLLGLALLPDNLKSIPGTVPSFGSHIICYYSSTELDAA